MNKKTIISILLIALVAIAGYYIWKSNVSKEIKLVNIGVILPLSGDVAPYGKNLQNGMNLALEQYNAHNGSDKKVKFIFEDDKADPKLAVTTFEKLSSIDKCKIILGCFSSSEVLSVAPIAEKNKIILISPTASAPNITNAGDYIFRTTPSDNFDGAAMANFAFNKLNLKKVAVLFVNNEYGLGISSVFEEKFKTLGGNISILKSFEASTKDFKTILKAIKDTKPEGLYIISVSDIGTILKQKAELSLVCKVMTVGLAENPEVVKIAGSASDSVFYSYPSYQINSGDTIIQKFVSAYKVKFGTEPDVLAAYGYDLANITLQCLNKEQDLNVEVVKENLYKLKNFPGVTGSTSFDKNGDVEKSIGIKMINHGKFEWYINNLK